MKNAIVKTLTIGAAAIIVATATGCSNQELITRIEAVEAATKAAQQDAAAAKLARSSTATRGIEPRRYVTIRTLAASFPEPQVLAALRGTGARYVVLHRKGYGPFQWERLQKGMPQALASGALREVAVLGTDTVYELGPGRTGGAGE